MNSTHAVSTFKPQSSAGLESQIETPVTQVTVPRRGNGDVARLSDEREIGRTSSHPQHHYEDGLHTLDLADQFDTWFENPRPAPPIPPQREVVRDNSSTLGTSNRSTRRSIGRGKTLFRSLAFWSKR